MSKGRRSVDIIIIGPIIVAMIVGAGVAIYFTGLLDRVISQVGEMLGSRPATVVEEMVEEDPGGVSAFVDLPSFIINLPDGTDRVTFLRFRVAVELADQSMVSSFNQRLPYIIDAIQTQLRNRNLEDLVGLNGMKTIRDILMKNAKRIGGEDVFIRDIIVRELIVQ